MKRTPITSKMVETQEEHSKEGGASMLVQVGDKTTQSNADIAAKSATMNKSAKEEA